MRIESSAPPVPTVSSRGDLISRPSQFIQELPENVFEKWKIEQEVEYVEEETEQTPRSKRSILDFYLKK